MSETSPSHTHLSVADAYDRWSESYDTYDNPMVFAATQVLRHCFAASDKGGASPAQGRDVVEFGCGTGRNLAALKVLGARSLTGLDLSARMLAVARARDPDFVLLQHDIAEAAPLPANSFDLALFCLALEHVGNLAAPLSEAHRLLRPGGTVEIVEIHPALSKGGIGAHFVEGDTTVTMPTFAHGYEDYAQALDAAGFATVAARDWRPKDFGTDLPAKLLKRGADAPWIIAWTATA